MALGVAKLLGYDIIKNFNRPYLATSITMFWKRWNISLTRWLTTYIYIPQGGSRKGKLRTYWNIILTFLVSGIWHGANWTFIFWGLIHGIAQCIEKIFGFNNKEKNKWLVPIRIALTFTIVNFAWIFFRLPSISDGFKVVDHIFSFGYPYIDLLTMSHALFAIVIVIPIELLMEFDNQKFHAFLSSHTLLRWLSYMFMILSILLFGVLNSGQFIYVSF